MSPNNSMKLNLPFKKITFLNDILCMKLQGNNIFQNLTSSQYKEVMKLLKHAILATDLAQYFK